MTDLFDVDDHARLCAVMLLDLDGNFLGTGFFVAQRIVVTCAHVVEKVPEKLLVGWSGRTISARVLIREPREYSGRGSYPFPDVAFIGVDNLDNPIGYVDSYIGSGVKSLVIHGFSRWTPDSEPVPDSVMVDVIGDAGAYKKIEGGHVVPGMSGAPVVDDAGTIRGMLKAGPMKYGQSGSVIHGNVIKSLFTEHRTVLGSHMRARPTLVRPRRGSPLQRMLSAQSEVAKQYPYRLAQLTRRATPPLSVVYVEQRTEAWVGPAPQHPGHRLAAVPEPVIISPTEMVRRHRNALVVGGPGGGKSTLLQQLVGECAAWWLGHNATGDEPALGRVVAIRSAATDLLGNRPWYESVALAVNHELGGFQDLRLPPEFFTRPPVAGAEWLIMIDGLDEVIDARQRARLVDMLAARVAEFGTEARFVVASRSLAEREFARLRASLTGPDRVGRLGEYNLRPFDDDAVELFATKWFRPPGGEPSPINPGEFLTRIREGGLGELVRVPLLATVAAVVYEERPSTPLPIDRAGLYDVFVTGLLTQRHQRLGSRELFLDQLAAQGKAAQEYGDFLFDHRLECLSQIALAQLRGDPRAPTEIAAEWIRSQGRRPPLGVTAEHLRELLLSTGLLVEERGELAFVHQSLAEYLASLLIVDTFDPSAWLRSVRDRGPDSLGMFALAGWVRAGNDPLPVVKSLLRAGEHKEYPDLPEIAAMIEDGGALVRGDRQSVVALTVQAVRRMGGLADRVAPTLNRVLRAVLQRAGSSGIVVNLATDARLPVTKRVEAARVLVTNGSAEDRRTGLATAVRLAYETRMSDEDRLWAQRTLAEIGGPDERPHAVQRMVQTVETATSEAVRVRALILLAQLNELPAAATALVRRGIDPRHSVIERIAALDALRVLVSSADPDEPWMPAGDHAARLDITSRIWPRPNPAPPSPEAREQLDRYTRDLGDALSTVGMLNPAGAAALFQTVMRDRSLGWARRVRLAESGRHWLGHAFVRQALLVLAEDPEEAPVNRVSSVELFADADELPLVYDRILAWLDDPSQPAALRHAALVRLMDERGLQFTASVAADRRYPAHLRVAAALWYGDEWHRVPTADEMLRRISREAGPYRWRRRLTILSARLSLRLSSTKIAQAGSGAPHSKAG